MRETRTDRSRGGRVGRVFGVGLAAVAVVAGGVACSSATGSGSDAAAKAPEAFGPAGYRGLTAGMTKEAALGSGALAPAPVSTLAGCTDFSYVGGPAPDPARMAAEAELDAKYKDLNDQADTAEAKSKEADAKADKGATGGSAEAAANHAELLAAAAEASADATKKIAAATQAIADRAIRREARGKLFAASGGASFGTDGLRELGAPPEAKTAEGIGAGSTLDELKKAYDAKGLKLAESDVPRYRVPVEGKPGWFTEFVVADGAKVNAISLINPEMKCA